MHQRKRIQTGLLGLASLLAFSAPVSASYLQTNLVSDGSVPGTLTDPNLVNPWGIAAGPTGPFWVSDNGTGVSTLYDGNTGQPFPLVVTIPPPPGSPQGTTSTPTGQVFNSHNNAFLLGQNQAARFIFATEGGTIAGWSSSTVAQTMVDNSAAGAVYKGLALASSGGTPFLYAANFSQGRIDVFDSNFGATALPGSFTDPNLPAGYSPFNIQELGGVLYVTYAEINPVTHDEIAGAGLGIVDAFDVNGNLIRRISTGGSLNAPWGVALAPADFGEFSNALLVGNFGDGLISAFDSGSDAFLGLLTDQNGQSLAIDGLWGLHFGNNGAAGKSNELYFTAGIDNETHGLLGRIVAMPGTVPLPEPDALALSALGFVLLAGMRVRAPRKAPADA